MAFHYLMFRTFCQATEDEVKVIAAMKFVSGSDEINVTKSSGFHGNPISILETEIRSKKRIDSVFSNFANRHLRELRDTLESRLDDDSNFFFRLDKQEAFEERIVITTHDDVIAVKGKVKAYPNNRENAMKTLVDYLDHLIQVSVPPHQFNSETHIKEVF